MKIGDRVGAIRDADKQTVYMYGYGIYQGEEVPPEGTIGAFGVDLGKIGRKNPKILLDDGTVVWGCQCWWGSEDRIKKEIIGDREVKIVGTAIMNQEEKT